MKTYIFHTDPGHGWVAVKREELIRLNILKEISPYSYQKGQTVYLEEDCDYGVFISAKEKHNEPFAIRESYQRDTPIRNYQPFSID